MTLLEIVSGIKITQRTENQHPFYGKEILITANRTSATDSLLLGIDAFSITRVAMAPTAADTENAENGRGGLTKQQDQLRAQSFPGDSTSSQLDELLPDKREPRPAAAAAAADDSSVLSEEGQTGGRKSWCRCVGYGFGMLHMLHVLLPGCICFLNYVCRIC